MVEEGPRSFDPGGEDEEVEVVKVSREASATGPSPERRRKVGKDQMSPVQVSPSPQIAREVSTMPPSTSQQTADTIPEQHLAMYPPGTGQNGYTSARTTGIVCHDQRHPEQVDNTAGMSSGIQEVNADSTHGLRANTAYTVGEGERDVEGFEERDGRNSSCASSISNGGTSSITMSASVSSQDGGDDGAAYVRRGSHDAEEDKEVGIYSLLNSCRHMCTVEHFLSAQRGVLLSCDANRSLDSVCEYCWFLSPTFQGAGPNLLRGRL